MDEKEFLNSLVEDKLKRSYRLKKKSALKEIDRDFKNEVDFLKTKYDKGIEDDRRHRDILNCCIYPFIQNGPLALTGYQFVRASPLAELEVKNVDFLLFKSTSRTNIAIFGECKGSGINPAKIVAECEQRKETIEGNLDYIKTRYLGLDPNDDLFVDYVIAVPDNDAPGMLKTVIETGGRFVVWHAPLTGKAKIALAFPPKRNLEMKLRESMIHRDLELNRAFQTPLRTDRSVFSVFPEGHPVSKMTFLISLANPGSSGLVVTKDEVIGQMKNTELYYLENDLIELEVRDVLNKAKDISFLEWVPEEEAYKIKCRGKRRDTLEVKLKEKWISHRLRTELERRKQKEVERVQEEFIKESHQPKQTKLF